MMSLLFVDFRFPDDVIETGRNKENFNLPEVPFFKHITKISLVKWTAYTILFEEHRLKLLLPT